MDKKLDTLYDLCETVSKELESANEKINGAGGELSAGDLEYLDKLTHTMKSLKTTIAMIESEDGHSGYYMGGRYYYDNSM
jgi:archaellum component FlaC